MSGPRFTDFKGTLRFTYVDENEHYDEITFSQASIMARSAEDGTSGHTSYQLATSNHGKVFHLNLALTLFEVPQKEEEFSYIKKAIKDKLPELSDDQIVRIVEAFDKICPHCKNGPASCQCGNEE